MAKLTAAMKSKIEKTVKRGLKDGVDGFLEFDRRIEDVTLPEEYIPYECLSEAEKYETAVAKSLLRAMAKAAKDVLR